MNQRGQIVNLIVTTLFFASGVAFLYGFAWILGETGTNTVLIESLIANPAATVGLIIFVVLIIIAIGMGILEANK